MARSVFGRCDVCDHVRDEDRSYAHLVLFNLDRIGYQVVMLIASLASSKKVAADKKKATDFCVIG